LTGGGGNSGRFTTRAALAVAIGAAIAIVGLVILAHGQRVRAPAPVAAETAAPVGPHLESVPCWFEIPAGRSARCGQLAAGPEAAGVPMAIRFVVFEGGAGSAADPLVYINGGPGSPVGIDAAGIGRWWTLTRGAGWLAGRDVVVFDQRGVGVSTPSLDCPELAEAGGRIFVEPMNRTESAVLWRDAASRCRSRLAAAGIRLEAFNTRATVEDLQRILDGLGYRSWNLYGVSYGTRVALEFLRQADGRTRSVIIDSVYPPDVRAYAEAGANARRAVNEIIRRCQGDPRCNTANPDLSALFERGLARAGSDGFRVQVTPPGGASRPAALDQAKLLESLFYGFYRWDSIEHMPSVMAALGNGDATPLAPLAQEAFLTAASSESGYGDFLAVECHDEYPFENAAAIERDAAGLGAFRDFVLDDLPLVACPVWPVGRAPDETRQPVHSAVPVLLLSGSLDPITPPDWARHAAETLDHGTVLVFPGIGHGVIAEHACAGRVAAKFLAAPGSRPFDDCLLGLG
jgi:pimeloyl-ACP methyl ester carboxylesterase